MRPKSFIPEEELLILYRVGNVKAGEMLMARYCGPARISHIRRVAPDLLTAVSLWEVSSIALQVYWQCLDGYRFCKGRFYSYFITSLRYAIFNYRREREHSQVNVVSLDDSLTNSENLCLSDIMSTETDIDDPNVYLEFVDTLNVLEKLPSIIEPSVWEVAKLKKAGFTYREIAQGLKISIRQAYSRYQKYCKAVDSLMKPLR